MEEQNKMIEYFKKNLPQIMTGIAIGIAYCYTINAIDSLITKIAMILAE